MEKNGAGAYELKPGLDEGINYQIISTEMMDVFKAYQGEKIEKIAHKRNGRKIVEIYGVDIQYYFISQEVVRDIDKGKKYENNSSSFNVSRYCPLKRLKAALMAIY